VAPFNGGVTIIIAVDYKSDKTVIQETQFQAAQWED